MKLLAFSLVLIFVCVTSAFKTIPELLDNPPKNGKLWAVLVAGSNFWYNYRHQADVCHAYQVLKNHGIPDERIIVMMYDDIANSVSNPTPGIIINHPDGKDVYKGVPHDYTGKQVTPENFMAVMRGDKKSLFGVGSGKVLQSGPNDHVFVYFSDHGASGLIAFPTSELKATDLNKTISYMHQNKKYGKMVLYIEACESGSMFANLLPNNINVYATTAANPTESSYAYYYDDTRDTYLGDEYSVKWLEDSDKENLNKETLLGQFKIVRNETAQSHVQEYGDLSIAGLHVSEFQGRKHAEPIHYPKVNGNPVRSRDVPIEIIKRKYKKANSLTEQKNLLKTLHKMFRNRSFLSDTMKQVVKEILKNEAVEKIMLNHHFELRNFQCYDLARSYFNEECFEISKNEYTLEYMHVLVNLCESGISPNEIRLAMERVCVHPPIHGIV